NYNLPSSTKFSVGSSTSLAAKNTDPFSGGTKKEINVVSKDDMDKLAADLTQNLEKNASNDINKKLPSDKTSLPIFLATDFSKKTFDKKEGDDAKTLSLTATISYTSMSFLKSDVSSFAQKALQNIPDQFSLEPNTITFSVSDVKQKNDTTSTATLKMHGALLPVIDTKTFAKNIAGKSFAQANQVAQSIPNFSTLQITLSPNLFFLPKILPKVSDHIQVNVTSQ
ncbi:MAG: hypothetical protein ACREGI_04125, partial [Candidatus Levyibacteriota bacterium]